jgi:hypothetical protein
VEVTELTKANLDGTAIIPIRAKEQASTLTPPSPNQTRQSNDLASVNRYIHIIDGATSSESYRVQHYRGIRFHRNWILIELLDVTTDHRTNEGRNSLLSCRS